MYKVVQLSSVHQSRDTRIFYKISNSLAKAGFDIDLIIQNEKDENVDGINLISLPISKNKWDRVFIIIPSLFLKCLKYNKNTIFHFHDPELIPIGILLKFFGYKIIYDIHEDVPKDLLTKEWVPFYLRKVAAKIVRILEWIAKKYFDHIIVVTSSIQERFKSDKTTLIQNFPIVDSDFHNQKENTDRESIFYVGDITEVRGIFEMLRALEILNQKYDCKMELAGRFSPQKLEGEIQKLGMDKFYNFHGWINKNHFTELVQKSIAGLVIFHPIPNHIEAQPNKLFEYMLGELPVVASNFPLWEQVVKNNKCGILVDPLKPQEIAEAILWLKDNPEEAKKMGKNGRKAVLEKYNWAAEEKKLFEVYEKLVN